MFRLLAAAVISVTSHASYISKSLSESDDDYIYIEIDIGTPDQSFDALVDTTNGVTWVFSESVNLTDDQGDGFDYSASSTWVSSSSKYIYTYENDTVNGTFGTDTLAIGSATLTSETIGVSTNNAKLFKDESLGAVLSLGRESSILTDMKSNEDIDKAAVTLDLNSLKMYFGDYSESLTNTTNLTVASSITALNEMWVFEFDYFYIDTASMFSCPCYGVIDAASPDIVFSISYSSFKNQIKATLTGGSSYMAFTVGNDTFYIDESDYYSDSEYKVGWVDQTDDYIVVYFGYPFLTNVLATLNAEDDMITISYTKSTSDKWNTVWIVLVCVVVFALLFFAFFCYKFKIPAAQRVDVVEEQSLLQSENRGDQQADPTGQRIGGTSAPADPARRRELVASRMEENIQRGDE